MTLISKAKIKLSSIFFFLLLAIGSTFFFSLYSFLYKPLDKNAGSKVFIIKSGESLDDISKNLEKKSIIKSSEYFKLFVIFKKAGKKLQAGEYLLSASKSPLQIFDMLLQGRINLYKITIPEGFNIKEISVLFAKKSLCSSLEFTKLCFDKKLINSFKIKANSLEGYLFPDTYFFAKQASCRQIISTLVKGFKKKIILKWESRIADLGFSLHDIVILASMIEKETGDASERPLISSVFHNRLKKKMRLESDPTVIYGIKDFNGNIKKKHLKIKTPYNTYRIKGLPLGPIANPGEMSLHAALYPAKTDYLFFVSKNDTTHKFSKTIKEHNKAVRKNQK